MSDITSALQDLEESVQRVERAIRENSISALVNPIGWMLLVLLLISCAGDAWHSKWRYAIQYGIRPGKVQVEDKPHDCNFIAAPLGDKYCHFDANVTTVRWATSTAGLPIVSTDDGKTWQPFTPDSNETVPKYSTLQSVYVLWEKKSGD